MHPGDDASGSVPSAGEMRTGVAESWVRSSAAGVDPDATLAPVILDHGDVVDYRSEHVLSRVFPLLYDVLGRAAVDCDAVMAVGDADGQLLWVCGSPTVLREAERIHFVEGASWAESAVGTNAPGVALHLDAPVAINGAEHFNRLVHPWSCAAAPIHDPLTRRILGVVDITGGEAIGTPQSLAMINAAARMAESELARLLATGALLGGMPDNWSRPTHAPDVRVSALGLPEAVVEVAGRSIRLSRRHSEILIALHRHPGGATADQLEVDVYPDGRGGSTLRVEMGRLRGLLGEDVLGSRPYRLTREIHSDWAAVEGHLATGRVREAVTAYKGPLLAGSDAPGVVEVRESLEGALRRAVLRSGEPDLMTMWTRSRWGADDLEMWEAQRATLSPTSPLVAVADAQVDRLHREFG